MIDMHQTILSNLDGEVVSLETSREVAEEAVNQGIDTIIAVPRFIENEVKDDRKKIIQKIELLNDRLKIWGLPLVILPGQQVMLHAGLLEAENIRNLIPLAGKSEYLLVELPSDHLPVNLNQLSFELQIQHLVPVFAQPELNLFLQKYPTELYQQVKHRAFVQISAASILGKNGSKAKKFANQLIASNLVHFVASNDSIPKRGNFYIKAAYKQIAKTHGEEMVEIFKENSQWLISKRMIIGIEPQRIQSKKLLGFL